MTEPQPPTQNDDVEGHVGRWGADAERDEGQDTQGHAWRWNADAESDENPDQPAR
jgi:hypothetical protein